ncbi:uncharacterized protein H6S33_009548 [Morchella sextelata]|uniref:uncharacterized protein n=1 Tax=Morchella sextelata TaxID=1174677 RepID=UPI001D056EC7|nr:uncharacterized protein H6S33_009548 [Morchella sextelata]KAH0613168.1 hypothetical protein H6S33_009548 [Morchella sextelata]
MPASIFPSYPPSISFEQSSYLLKSFIDWSLFNGLSVRPLQAENQNGALAVHAPVTLFPSPFPRACFEEAKAVQIWFNELYARIAADEEWLLKIVDELIEVDDFMARLYKVHLDVKKEGFIQDLSLGIFRSNSTPSLCLLGVSRLAFRNSIDTYCEWEIANGLAAAHKAYGLGGSGRNTAILFIIQDDERNIFDQRLIEYNLLENHDIQCYRITIQQVPDLITLDPVTRALIYHPPHDDGVHMEISTAYFRSCYDPEDFHSETDWVSRTTIERSKAIKCPSVITQLAGAKKVQQVLAMEGTVERFLPDTSISTRIQNTFAAIYPLDTSSAGLAARDLALNNPEKYVLKPQREGGGNNIYRSKIPDFLKSIPESHWSSYILMELIEPPSLGNSIVRNGIITTGEVICELGIFGAVLWRNGKGIERGKGIKEIVVNEETGWLLRTKGRDSEEGGVAAGFGSVDGILLVD